MVGCPVCMLALRVNPLVDGNSGFPMLCDPQDYHHRVPGHFYLQNDGFKSKNHAKYTLITGDP